MRNLGRPTGITVLSILAFISGAIGTLSWLSKLAGKPIWGAGGAAFVGGAYDYWTVLLILSVLQVAFAYGAWTLKPWGWWLGMALQVVSIAFALLYVVLGSSFAAQMLTILISAVLLYYLLSTPVRQAFRRA
jgi:hypothetical protein